MAGRSPLLTGTHAPTHTGTHTLRSLTDSEGPVRGGLTGSPLSHDIETSRRNRRRGNVDPWVVLPHAAAAATAAQAAGPRKAGGRRQGSARRRHRGHEADAYGKSSVHASQTTKRVWDQRAGVHPVDIPGSGSCCLRLAHWLVFTWKLAEAATICDPHSIAHDTSGPALPGDKKSSAAPSAAPASQSGQHPAAVPASKPGGGAISGIMTCGMESLSPFGMRSLGQKARSSGACVQCGMCCCSHACLRVRVRAYVSPSACMSLHVCALARVCKVTGRCAQYTVHRRTVYSTHLCTVHISTHPYTSLHISTHLYASKRICTLRFFTLPVRVALHVLGCVLGRSSVRALGSAHRGHGAASRGSSCFCAHSPSVGADSMRWQKKS